MKKLFIIIIIVLIMFCCYKINLSKDSFSDKKISKEENNVIDDIINNMSLEEKIGQLFFIAYRSNKIDDTLIELLDTIKPGGFILFSENITTYQDTLEFIKYIKESNDIPLFVGIDEEGGNVQRLTNLKDYKISNIPFMYKVKNSYDAYNIGKVIAEELRVFGINLDFAPVIDTVKDSNSGLDYRRSFGNDSSIVSNLGISLANGLYDNKVVPVYKHFPNHGAVLEDSHDTLPIINKSKEELLTNDLIPFRDAINDGASVIMVGHLAVPSITNDNTPASLSYELVTNLLRQELNYSGVVITDALNMDALTDNYTEEEIIVNAINAGVDILLMPNDPLNDIEIIKEAINNNKISIDRINESVKRILTLKYNTIYNNYDEYLSVSYLNNAEHKKILEDY